MHKYLVSACLFNRFVWQETRRGEPSKIAGEHEWFHALLHRRSWRLDGARRIEREGQNVHDRQSIDRTMLEHDIAAGLNVPVRLMIYEEPATRTTRVTYDLPSSLMSGLKNEKVTAAAKKLDAKLIALGVHASGAQA